MPILPWSSGSHDFEAGFPLSRHTSCAAHKKLGTWRPRRIGQLPRERHIKATGSDAISKVCQPTFQDEKTLLGKHARGCALLLSGATLVPRPCQRLGRCHPTRESTRHVTQRLNTI